MQQQVRARCLNGESLVEIGRSGGVERDEGAIGAVGMFAGRARCGGLGRSQNRWREAGGHLILRADRGEAVAQKLLRVAERFHGLGACQAAMLAASVKRDKPQEPTCNEDPRRRSL